MVQRRPETSSKISHDDTRPSGHGWDCYLETGMASLSVLLGDDDTGIGFVEDADFLLHSLKMFLCPGYLQVSIINAGSGHDRTINP